MVVLKLQFVLFVVATQALYVVWSSPPFKSGVSECYNHICPVGTYSCKKHTYLSQDKTHLDVDISCLDREKRELQQFHEQEANPFKKGILYESYSYSSVYLFEREPPNYSKFRYSSSDTTANNSIK